MQVGRVDQRAVDVDQRRHAAAGVDPPGHVTAPSASQAPDRVPAAGCPAPAAPDPAHWAAWAARGSAATDRAAPASAARPAAEAWTTLAWRLTTRAAVPRNHGIPQRRVGAGRSAGPNLPLRSDLVDSALDLVGGVVDALLEIALGLVALALGLEIGIVLELTRLLLGGALHLIDVLAHVLYLLPACIIRSLGPCPRRGRTKRQTPNPPAISRARPAARAARAPAGNVRKRSRPGCPRTSPRPHGSRATPAGQRSRSRRASTGSPPPPRSCRRSGRCSPSSARPAAPFRRRARNR